jgi:DNA-binding MarR family transcriptional regulator
LPNLHTAPGHLFRRGRQLHDALWAVHVTAGLTPLQYALLTALELEPNIDQRTLGDRIALDKSTIGELLVRMADRGLISRRSDRNDARRRLLELTDQGREALYATAPAVKKIGDHMLGALDPDERAELMRLLDKVVYSPAALELTPGVDPEISLPRDIANGQRPPAGSGGAAKVTPRPRRRALG